MAKDVEDHLDEPPSDYFDEEPPPDFVELAPWETPPAPPEPPAPNGTNGSHPEPPPDEPTSRYLRIWSTQELADHVAKLPPVNWLAQRVWPGDAYGVVAAEKKAGKSWAALDIAVSVASGSPWLGRYAIERKGPVLAFLGEGGERKMQRRLDAVCESRGCQSGDLPIRLCFRVPHLTGTVHLAEVQEELEANPPVLAIVDPLYLAARGAQSSQLNEMGAALENIQVLCQRAGSALVIVHHWNQGGKGKGSDRFTGAGSAEWGRVLVSVAVKSKKTDEETGRSDVVLDWFFEGDEIPDSQLRIRRSVWVDEQDDLSSPMHYEVEVLDHKESATGDGDGPEACKEAVLDLLFRTQIEYSSSSLAKALKDEGKGFRAATVKTAAEQLAVETRIRRREGPRKGVYYRWDQQMALDNGDASEPEEPF